MNTETEKLVTEARDRQIWFAFFVSHRDLVTCDANKLLLDSWLTEQLKPLTPETLEEAYAAISSQLAKRTSAVQPQAPAPQVITPSEVHTATTEADPNPIPVEFTKKAILAMDRESYKPFLKKWGARWIEDRLARKQEAQ